MFTIDLLVNNYLYIQRTPNSKILRCDLDGTIKEKYENISDLPYSVRYEIETIEHMHKNPNEYFNCMKKSDGTIKLVEFIAPEKKVSYPTNIIIPQFVNGCQVSELSNHLLATTNHCGIENLVIPDSVTTIGHDLCAHNRNLKRVVLSNNLKTIPKFCFSNCEELEYIKLPEGIEALETFCFFGCHSLKTINFPETLLTIGDEVFKSSGLVGTITLPKNIKEIGKDIFQFCKVDKIYIYSKTNAEDSFHFEDKLKVYEYADNKVNNVEEKERI